jgi:hypothetical protein
MLEWYKTMDDKLLKKRATGILNIAAFFGFIAYGIGIYLWVTRTDGIWLNPVINILLKMGPLPGVLAMVAIGAGLLIGTLLVDRLAGLNVFFCWFFILSLYQCALNTILTVYGFSEEPINCFFRAQFPAKWYPVKECVFTVMAVFLTWLWARYIWKSRKLSRFDLILITVTALLLIGVLFAG